MKMEGYLTEMDMDGNMMEMNGKGWICDGNGRKLMELWWKFITIDRNRWKFNGDG